MEKPRTYNADLARLPAALLPLTAQRRWVVWPWEARATKNGAAVKWTKPPRMAHDPSRNARSNDPETWGSYADAVAAVAALVAVHHVSIWTLVAAGLCLGSAQVVFDNAVKLYGMQIV